MKLEELTREEKSLLLFLESCATEHAGSLDPRHMNDDDKEIIKKWTNSKFIQYGRIAAAYLNITTVRCNWVNLSDEAWDLAHQERKSRFIRMNNARVWKKSIEIKRLPNGINKEPKEQ
jgi:hypothetical protein